MKKTYLIASLIIVALVAAGVAFFQGSVSGVTETERPGQQKQPPQVRAVTAMRSEISEALELTGSVEPYRVARLASPAEGPVDTIRVREADRVEANEPLLSIGRKKGVDAAIISLREELKKEEENLGRVRQLVESELVPAEQLDQASATHEKVRASLVKAEETADDYTIKAPWSGVVSLVHVKEGEFVAPRAILLQMYDPASLIIRASIPEKYATEVTAGMLANVRLDAYPDTAFQGYIDRVYPYLDSRLRTRTVEILLNEPVKLLPGMFARLTLSLKRAEGVVVVPLEALVSTPKGHVVFVFEEGKATARIVKTGIEADNRVEIISGVQSGDKVIVAGNEKLKDGADVRVTSDERSGSGKSKGETEPAVGKPGNAGDSR